MPPQYQPTRETDENILKLLTAIAFPDDKATPLTVVTTDYRLWAALFPRQQITILDISLLSAPYPGRANLIESEIEREVMRRLLSVGWPSERIIQQYISNSGARSDFALLGGDGKVVAIVEVKGGALLLGSILKQATEAAKLAPARYAIVTNGKQVLLSDAQSDVALDRATLPSPEDLTLEAPPRDIHELATAPASLSVVTAFDFQELLEAIRRSGDNTLIVDHTIPWGTRIPDLLAMELPPTLGKAERMDLSPAIMGVASARVPQGTVVGFVLPATCTSPTYRQLRQFFADRLHLGAVVSLPSGVFGPQTSVKSMIVKLAPKQSDTSRVTYFFSLSSPNELSDIDTQDWFTSFKDDLKAGGSKLGFRAKVSAGELWTCEAHHPAAKRAEERIAKYGKVLPLGDLFDVLQGFRHSRKEVSEGKGVPVVRGRDITAGAESRDQLTDYEFSADPPERLKIRAGDLLIQRIGANPACTVANPGLIGAIASDTIFILRPKAEDADSFLISQFFNSIDGQILLSGCLAGAGAPTLSVAALRSLLVPILDNTVSRDLQELSQVELALRVKAEKLRSLRLKIFDADSSAALQSRLREIRQHSKSVAASIEQAESFPFQIRNFYPYPLAYPYRLLVGINNPVQLYGQQLRVAENVLAFLTSVALALIDERDRVNCNIDLPRYWQGGINPGQWREISQKAVLVLDNYKNHRLAQSMSALWADTGKKGFFQRMDVLIKLKNDMKHDRGPKTEDDFSDATRSTGEILVQTMHDIAFLTEHPIRLVQDMDVARGTRSVVLYTLRCEGDHPGFAQERVSHPEALTKNDLFIEVESDRWAPLFPFIVPRTCPQCKLREIYFVDKWQGKDRPALLKSFEQGHTVENGEVGRAFEAWQNGA